MKIGIDVQLLIPNKTGIGNVILNWIKKLAIIDFKNQYILFGQSWNKNPLCHIAIERNKFDFIDVPSGLPKYLGKSFCTLFRDQVQLYRYMTSMNCHIWYFPYFIFPLFSKGKKLIITIHDMDMIMSPHRYSWKQRIYRNTLIRCAVLRAKLIITISDSSKKDIVRLLKIHPDRIRVVYPGVDDIFKPFSKGESKKLLKKKFGIFDEYILYTGGFASRKNLYRLIKGFALAVNKKWMNGLLLLTGNIGTDKLKLKKFAKQLGIEDKIVFTGYVSEKDLPLFYSGAKVLLYPSLNEGFGLPVIEAMACGTPVITSNISSLAEITAGSAYLVNPYDTMEIALSIKCIWQDSILRHRLIKMGLSRAKQFNWESGAEKLLSIFEEIGT